MKTKRAALAATLLLAFSLPLVAQDDFEVSKKKDVAVFALGYYGYNIPSNVLATVDAEIQNVFVNLGRFNVLGQTVRFSSADINQFIEILRKAKEENTPLPDEVKFGEVQLTEALLNQLYGSFVVVIPTITSYSSEYNSKDEEYQTRIKTSVAFIDVAEGTTFGWAQIDTSGSSKETQQISIQNALSGIAPQLEFKVRSIPAFTITSRILSANLIEARMQLGQDMGIKKGDEYVIIEKKDIMGFEDEVEAGLIMIKDVQSRSSTATILYGDGDSIKEGAQIRELPRQGLDIGLSLGYLRYFQTLYDYDDGARNGAATFSIKVTGTRGFYSLRPAITATALIDGALWYPVIFSGGVDWNLYMRRMTLTANAGLSVGTSIVLRIIELAVEEVTDTEDDDAWVSHVGINATLGVSYLLNRDVKLYADGVFTYMFGFGSGPFASYGGFGANAGVCFKL